MLGKKRVNDIDTHSDNRSNHENMEILSPSHLRSVNLNSIKENQEEKDLMIKSMNLLEAKNSLLAKALKEINSTILKILGTSSTEDQENYKEEKNSDLTIIQTVEKISKNLKKISVKLSSSNCKEVEHRLLAATEELEKKNKEIGILKKYLKERVLEKEDEFEKRKLKEDDDLEKKLKKEKMKDCLRGIQLSRDNISKEKSSEKSTSNAISNKQSESGKGSDKDHREMLKNITYHTNTIGNFIINYYPHNLESLNVKKEKPTPAVKYTDNLSMERVSTNKFLFDPISLEKYNIKKPG